MPAPTHVAAARRLRSRRGVGRDRGSSSIQMVVLMPALFSIMFLGMQGALMYQARTVALAAAEEGARAAAAENGAAAAGIETASVFASTSSAGLRNTHVTGSRSATTATITVHTNSLSVIPGWKPSVTQSASLPVERITGTP